MPGDTNIFPLIELFPPLSNRISIDRLVFLPATIGLTFNYCWWIHLAVPCTLITLESISLPFFSRRGFRWRGKQKSRKHRLLEPRDPRRSSSSRILRETRSSASLSIFGNGSSKNLEQLLYWYSRLWWLILVTWSWLLTIRQRSGYLIESIKTYRSSINDIKPSIRSRKCNEKPIDI